MAARSATFLPPPVPLLPCALSSPSLSLEHLSSTQTFSSTTQHLLGAPGGALEVVNTNYSTCTAQSVADIPYSMFVTVNTSAGLVNVS